jgi:hypothetical protein
MLAELALAALCVPSALRVPSLPYLLPAPRLQSIEPEPARVEAGRAVRIFVRAADGAGSVGVPVVARTPDGEVQDLGVTDQGGRADFVPDRAGSYRLAAVVGGVELVAALEVVPASSRVLAILLAVPLGLAFGWWNVSRLRRGR